MFDPSPAPAGGGAPAAAGAAAAGGAAPAAAKVEEKAEEEEEDAVSVQQGVGGGMSRGWGEDRGAGGGWPASCSARPWAHSASSLRVRVTAVRAGKHPCRR